MLLGQHFTFFHSEPQGFQADWKSSHVLFFFGRKMNLLAETGCDRILIFRPKRPPTPVRCQTAAADKCDQVHTLTHTATRSEMVRKRFLPGVHAQIAPFCMYDDGVLFGA